MKVGAVVVTYNRCHVLMETLQAIDRQTRRPDVVMVVDNASTDSTCSTLRRFYPAVRLLSLPENLGYGAGLAAGIGELMHCRIDKIWLMDDDSHPKPYALEMLLTASSQSRVPALVGLGQEATLHLGVPRWKPTRILDSRRAQRVDAVLVDNALVDASLVERVGTPRRDFFMMFEDVEYCWRIHRAGLQVLAVGDPDVVDRLHLGSGGQPWRSYYQSRNHLRAALDLHSAGLVVGWLLRQLRLVAAELLQGDQVRPAMRTRGAVDALRRHMGRTLLPPSS